MRKMFNLLILLFFLGFFVPSAVNFFGSLNEHVIQGKMPFREFAQYTAQFSYRPVWKFYVNHYKNLTKEEKTDQKEE